MIIVAICTPTTASIYCTATHRSILKKTSNQFSFNLCFRTLDSGWRLLFRHPGWRHLRPRHPLHRVRHLDDDHVHWTVRPLWLRREQLGGKIKDGCQHAALETIGVNLLGVMFPFLCIAMANLNVLLKVIEPKKEKETFERNYCLYNK